MSQFYSTPRGLNEEQVRACASFFAANPAAPGAYLWEDGSLHDEQRLGASLSFWVPREAALRYSRRGDWAGEVAFLDQLRGEDEAYAAAWAVPQEEATMSTETTIKRFWRQQTWSILNSRRYAGIPFSVAAHWTMENSTFTGYAPRPTEEATASAETTFDLVYLTMENETPQGLRLSLSEAVERATALCSRRAVAIQEVGGEGRRLSVNEGAELLAGLDVAVVNVGTELEPRWRVVCGGVEVGAGPSPEHLAPYVEELRADPAKAKAVREAFLRATSAALARAAAVMPEGYEADPELYACPDGPYCTDPECKAENERRAIRRRSTFTGSFFPAVSRG